MAEVVGTAYVRIRALTNQLSGDIKDGIDKGMKDVDVDTSGVTKKMKKAFAKAGDDSGKSFSDRLAVGLKDAERHMKGFADKLKRGFGLRLPPKAWLAILAIPGLGGALKLAGAYILTLVGQIGYVVQAAAGAGVALLGAFGILATAALPLILAFKTESGALELFNEAIKDQAAAWHEVGFAVQEGLLPPLADAFGILSDGLIPGFTELGTKLGEIFGEAALAGSEILTSTENMGHWQTIFDATATTMQTLMAALVPFLGAMPNLFAAAAPLAQDLATAIASMMTNFAAFVERASASGQLQASFDLWWERAKNIGASLWNIVEVLWEIFRIGADVVAPQFDTLRNTTQGWVDDIKKPENQALFKQLFENALPVAQEFNGLMGDIIELFKGAFTGDTTGVQDFIVSIREVLLPALVTLVDVLGEGLADSMVDLTDSLIAFLEAMAEEDALGKFVDALVLILDILTDLTAIPGFAQFLGYLLAFGTLVSVFAPVISAIGSIVGVIGTVVGAISSFVGFFSAMGLGIGGMIAALGAAIAPILAVIAVIAGLVLLIMNWDKVVAFFEDVWENIVEAFNKAWDAISEFFSNLGETMSEIGDTIGRFFSELPGKIAGWVASAGAAIGGFFTSIWDAIVSFVTGLPAMMADAAKALWQWIVDAVPVAIEWLTNFVANLIGFLIMLPVNIAFQMYQAHLALWKWIQDAVPKALEWLGNMWDTILNWITTTIDNIGTNLQAATEALWIWIQNAVPNALTWLGNMWDEITAWIDETIDGIGQRAGEMIDSFLKWIEDATTDIPGRLREFGQQIWDWITDFVGGLPQRFEDAITNFLGFGQAIIDGIVEGLDSAIQGIASWGGRFIAKIKAAIIEHAPEPLKSLLQRAMGGGGGNGTSGASATAASTMATSMRAGGPNLMGPTPMTPMALAVPTGAVPAMAVPNTGSQILNLSVHIGERDITDLIDARISDNDRATAQSLFVRRR